MKKMLLKGVSLFLVLLMIYSSVPVSVFATVDFTETQMELITEEETTEPQTEGEEPGEPLEEELQEYSYAVNEDNTLVITAYNGEEKFVTIPATIDEMTVVAIGANAFANNTTILEVTIPEGVIEIGEGAFVGCPQLRNVLVPESVTLISETAFENHPNLTLVCYNQHHAHIYAKDNSIRFKLITSAEESLVTGNITDTLSWRFNLVTGLLCIEGNGAIPNNASTNTNLWGDYASKITGLILGDGITSIGQYAFQSCAGIKGDLIIPDSVINIGEGAFRYCSGFNGTLKLSNNLITIPNYAFEGCGSFVGELVIPDSVTRIENYAFSTSEYVYDNSVGDYRYRSKVRIPNITSLVLGNSLSVIGTGSHYADSVFLPFTGIKEVTFKGTTVPTRGYADMFYSMNNLEKVFVPAESYDAYVSALSAYVNNGRILVDGSGEFTIIDGVLKVYNGDGGDIVLPNTVETIGSSAFQNCTTITSVTFGENVKSVGTYAFDGCTGLTSVIFNEGLESIGGYAFRNCKGLTSLEFNKNLKTIANYSAFEGCTGLTSVIFNENLETIGTYTFNGCTGLTGDLTIPESVKSIGSYAFQNCSGIEGKVTIEGNEAGTTIGEYAFKGCSKISSLELGEGITDIGHYAFQNCAGIKGDLIIPDSVINIGEGAFRYCSGFNGTLKLSNNLIAIPNYAFEGCGSFVGELVIPDSVTRIENYAFSTSEYVYDNSVGDYRYRSKVRIPNITSLVLGNSLSVIGTASHYADSVFLP